MGHPICTPRYPASLRSQVLYSSAMMLVVHCLKETGRRNDSMAPRSSPRNEIFSSETAEASPDGVLRPLERDDSRIPRPLTTRSALPFRQTIRRSELRHIVPVADTTIYEMEQRGEFPRRFYLTPRCVVWDLAEIEAWIEERRRASDAAQIKRAPTPDVRQRKTRPVRQ